MRVTLHLVSRLSNILDELNARPLGAQVEDQPSCLSGESDGSQGLLAIEVQVAQQSAPGAPVWRVVMIQKLADRPR
jgi:hypothetical protein